MGPFQGGNNLFTYSGGGRPGSNRQSPAYRVGALPIELLPHAAENWYAVKETSPFLFSTTSKFPAEPPFTRKVLFLNLANFSIELAANFYCLVFRSVMVCESVNG